MARRELTRELTPFGKRLDQWRMEAGFRTLRAFARALQMPESSVSRLMRQNDVPKVATLKKLADTLGRDVQELHALAMGSDEVKGPGGRADDLGAAGQVTEEAQDQNDGSPQHMDPDPVYQELMKGWEIAKLRGDTAKQRFKDQALASLFQPRETHAVAREKRKNVRRR